ncbi:ST7 protein [Anaerovirgula multivorans]|uniref:ST7 protein n=1 Tax=Anaerovirgula multivorans TaxID=312168 RepID=A0A239F687_9FIRM|nr:DUF6398 domain-containing protein [Anaerovirgula multivorans]SNS52560.1 ST7 protein [Anaerovirgula multivorans]
MAKKKSMSVPKTMQDKYTEISSFIEGFCDKYLNEEYKFTCLQLCAALCRKRPSPLATGRGKIWACAIVHAVGSVNFLFDPSQIPHMKAGELYHRFEVSNNTASSKSKLIRDMIGMTPFDPEWTLPSKIEDNPLAWMIMVDGLAIDARQAPLEIQEIAFEKGLIPYIPDQKSEIPQGKVIEFPRRTQKSKSERKDPKKLLEQAQELAYQAMGADSSKESCMLAHRALALSQDCVDAYMILAEEEAKTSEEVINFYQKAVEAGERIIGKENFRDYEGHFWGFVETRPYMMARFALADMLWSIGKKQEAIDHCKDILRLNPNDNQGIRYILLNWLLEISATTDIERLFKEYEDEWSAAWLYSKALYYFREKKKSQADKMLKEAFESNAYVPLYILGKKKIPKSPPEFIGIGDVAEAEAYVWDAIELWEKIPNAKEWIKNHFDAFSKKSC